MTDRVLCVGGDTCHGYGLARAWPEILWQVHDCQVQNAARRGHGLIDTLRLLQRAPVTWGRWTHVVVQPGPADARGSCVPPHEYGLILGQVLDTIRDRWPEAVIAACTPTPITGHGASGYQRGARRWPARATTEAMLAIGDSDARLVALHDLPTELLSSDGLHVTPSGQQAIARLVAAALWADLGHQ